jgi:hypothetical protein
MGACVVVSLALLPVLLWAAFSPWPEDEMRKRIRHILAECNGRPPEVK